METLIRELESLRKTPQLSNDQVVGIMLSTTMRFRDILTTRMAGMQAMVTAVAMQPQIDVRKLHDDFVSLLLLEFESMRNVPTELKDVAASLKLVAAERRK